MKRFSSIDFLRGVAMIMMLMLHIISDKLDLDYLLPSLDYIPLVNLIMLVVLPFLGGMAGFFLLVSAIGNSISMTKYLMKGKSVKSLAVRQIMGGIILLIFAMLSEGTIGYHGAFGGLFGQLGRGQGFTWNWNDVFSNWARFETIHTIAWCIIINGAVHGLISSKEGWKNPKKQMIIYAILAVLVLTATPFIWSGLSNSIGYPYPRFVWDDATVSVSPHLFKSPFVDILKAIFLAPLTAEWEPIFPYLATSFIGSMIGIGLAQPDKGVSKRFAKGWLLTGLIMFLAGFVGIVFVVVLNNNMNLDIYQIIPNHRAWAPDYPNWQGLNLKLSWTSFIWQFLALNGFALMCTMIIIYLVEFRGRGEKFAEKTKFVRRFGFVALSAYNMQYFYNGVSAFVPPIFGLAPHARMMWATVLLQIAITMLIYHVIFLLWEKVNYKGSLEWFIATIASFLVPGKGVSKSFFSRGDLAVDGGFYNVEWINIVEEDETYHARQKDSKIAKRLAIMSFAVPLFVPATCLSIFLALGAQKKEGKNKHNQAALVLSIIGVVLTLAFTAFLFATTLYGLVGGNALSEASFVYEPRWFI